VGGDPDHVGGVDNFCWPSIQYDPQTNPDGRFKAAQLVRANLALKDVCLTYGIPLLSGKDSMYVDGALPGAFGERHKVSGLPTLQFTAVSVMPDVSAAVTLDFKDSGDPVYMIGLTRDELGASEYYEMLGYIGRNVPRTDPARNLEAYRAYRRALEEGLVASAKVVGRGGLGAAATLCSGSRGAFINLDNLPAEGDLSPDRALFSESTGRLLVSVRPAGRERFEEIFGGLPCAFLGKVRADDVLLVRSAGEDIIRMPLDELRDAFQRPFGHLI
jgi:phosphoribosylformylglycinamidine synthase